MKVLSHRGIWTSNSEKNTYSAFVNSFRLGFGTETDVRDYMGELVISHDIPKGREISLLNFLKLAETFVDKDPITLALNIKADGLAIKIDEILKQFHNLDCFIFDMSVPDTRAYFDEGSCIFTRMSEVEQTPVWLDKSSGVWLDAFEEDWYDVNLVQSLLLLGKRVCIVSPELHGRDYKYLWQCIYELKNHSDLMICTDFPLRAKAYFGVK